MESKIEARILERKLDLKTLESALKVFGFKTRPYSYCDGRIREVTNEINWLEEVSKGING